MKTRDSGVDAGGMGIPPIGSGSSPFSAVAAGLRGQMKAQNMKTALEIGGLADPGLVKALGLLEQQGRQIAEGGLEIAKAELSGQVIDLLA